MSANKSRMFTVWSSFVYSEIPGGPKGISESSHLCSQQSVKLLHTKIPGSLEPGF